MAKQPIPAQESFADMSFPVNGIDLSSAFGRQAAQTTPVGKNVRAFETLTQRARGGSRPGLAKYNPAQVGGASALIQDLNSVVGVGYTPPGLGAAIIVVQHPALVGGNSTSISATFTSNVTAGNTIVVLVTSADVDANLGSLPTSVTDSQGNTYTRAVQTSGAGSGVNPGGSTNHTGTYCSIWYSVNVVGGATTVTAHYASAAAGGIQIVEVSGLTATPLDQANGHSGTGSPGTTGAITTTLAGEIIFTCIQGFLGVNESQTLGTLGAPWTNLYGNVAGSRPGDFEYQIVTAIQTGLNPSWGSWSTTVQGFSACIATFKGVASVQQASQSGRIVTLVAVQGGAPYVCPPGGITWTAAANTTGKTLATTGVVRSAANNQKLWFADGSNYLYYDPSQNKVLNWVASTGTLPVDTAGNTPRLICTWRGRTVLSGLLLDGQNWFMSAVGDPTNWNYFPTPVVATQAVVGNNSSLGLVGDVITALIPYTDDTLIFGGDHTIWVCNGDPMAGGSINLISDTIGMAWGIPWCKGPDGTLYFVSNKLGVYNMIPGQTLPVRMSQQIEQLLNAVDSGANLVRMMWDDQWQGFHLFITPTASASSTTHLFWEQRTGAWWQDAFGNNNHNPLCCTVFDGNTTSDRRSLVGSWDGYVRVFTPTATTDDGTSISSSVMIGPILTKDLDDVLLKDIQGVLATGSGNVTYAVYIGSTAEAALAAAPVATGTWTPGRNLDTYIRRAAHAIFVQISSTSQWGMEGIRARVAGRNKVRRRGY